MLKSRIKQIVTEWNESGRVLSSMLMQDVEHDIRELCLKVAIETRIDCANVADETSHTVGNRIRRMYEEDLNAGL